MNLTPEMRRAMERRPVHRAPNLPTPTDAAIELRRRFARGLKSDAMGSLKVQITGQIRGGKNSVKTTKKGHRYPNKEWAKWRDHAVREVVAQIPKGWKPISQHTNVRMEYFAGDKRRRDMPAIIDAAFHVLERAGFTEDDTHLWVAESSRAYNKENPRLIITIL